MDFRELFTRVLMPVKPKVNDDELLKAEETNYYEVIEKVKLILLI